MENDGNPFQQETKKPQSFRGFPQLTLIVWLNQYSLRESNESAQRVDWKASCDNHQEVGGAKSGARQLSRLETAAGDDLASDATAHGQQEQTSGAQCSPSPPAVLVDPLETDLRHVVDHWPNLSPAIRQTILEIIRATAGK
nr:hypothetical protein [Pirellula staleyi]